MKDQEKRIREQRSIEAARKNLMGPSGKLGCICRFMGEPIRQHGGGFVETTYLDAPWYNENTAEDSSIPTLDEDDNVFVIGWFFDGTTSGVHMEIRYMDSLHELSVRWHGHLVYREVRGELDSYVPRADWEQKVDSLFEAAKAREKKIRVVEVEEEHADVQRQKETWLQKMAQKWGLK